MQQVLKDLRMYHTTEIKDGCIFEEISQGSLIQPKQHSLEVEHNSNVASVLDREAFIMTATELLKSRGRQGSKVSLAVVDLDRLKRANDNYGHAFGDMYIRDFSNTLSELTSSSCCVGRLGGDEFAVLFYGEDSELALARLDRLRAKFIINFPDYLRKGLGGISIGLCSDNIAPYLFEDIYYKADVALYAAKEYGRNRTKIYSDYIMEHFDIEQHKKILNTAIFNANLMPAFQPIVDIKSGLIVGYEALARIKLDDGRILKPNRFFKGFRDRDCARRVTKAMLDGSLQNWCRLRKYLPSDSRLSINITEFDIMDVDFFRFTEECLERYSLDWSDLILEIVETAILDPEVGRQIEVLNEFRQRGVLIALDDFGNGYATLMHLANWPVDILKIDKDIVKKIPEDGRIRKIASCVFGLAKELEIKVIVEGVENEETMHIASQEGADLAQGYYFGAPQYPAVTLAIFESKSCIKISQEVCGI